MMTKKERMTFVLLALNFLITGMVVDRPSFLENDILFAVLIIGGAYGLTKYVFYISRKMDK